MVTVMGKWIIHHILLCKNNLVLGLAFETGCGPVWATKLESTDEAQVLDCVAFVPGSLGQVVHLHHAKPAPNRLRKLGRGPAGFLPYVVLVYRGLTEVSIF